MLKYKITFYIDKWRIDKATGEDTHEGLYFTTSLKNNHKRILKFKKVCWVLNI